ncbi:MAG: S8 family serine peptidase [Phycisphaerae bacterium]
MNRHGTKSKMLTEYLLLFLGHALVFLAQGAGTGAGANAQTPPKPRPAQAVRATPQWFTQKGGPQSIFAEGRVLIRLRTGGKDATTHAATPILLPGVERLDPLSGGRSPTAAQAAGAPQWFIARLTPGTTVKAAIQSLSAHPGVDLVEPDFVRHLPTPVPPGRTVASLTDDPLVDQQYALGVIHAPEAWALNGGDPSVIVAVIDTGAELNHPDLGPHIWRNPVEATDGVDDDGNGYVDDIHGWDFADDDSDPSDEIYHGTHVAGIIAAVRNNGIGVAGAANVTVMPVKVFDAYGGASDSSVIQGIEYAVANGASVINMSLGGGWFSQALNDACEAAVADGVVVVAAAGNEFASVPSYPANFASVIAVGASDSHDRAADYSNRGYGLEVMAPGEDILSTFIGSDYDFLSGTSMASPYAAAVVALMRSAHPELDAATARARLSGTADDLGEQGWDQTFGYGRVNAIRALTETTEQPPPPEPPDDAFEPNDSLEQAQAIEPGRLALEGWDEDWFVFDVTEGSEVTITIDGPEGDLDLFLFDEDGDMLAQSINVGTHDAISQTVSQGRFFILVVPYAGQTSSYTLTLDVTPGAGSGDDDAFEPNNSSGEAPTVEPGQFELQGLDDDWFAFEVSEQSDVTITIDGPEGDLDLFLMDANGEPLAGSVDIGSHDAISRNVVPGRFFILVVPYAGQTSSYTLTLEVTPGTGPDDDDAFEQNDSIDEAAAIEPGQFDLEGLDEDWFVFEVSEPSHVTIVVDGPEGDLDLYLVDQNGQLLAGSARDVSSQESITLNVGSGSYDILVVPYSGQTSSYTLTLEVTPAPAPPDDVFEPNDSIDEAVGIEPGQYNLEGWDEDWFSVYVAGAGTVTVSIDGPEGDLDLLLLDTDGEMLGLSADWGSQESLTVELSEGRYNILVVPYESQGSSYSLFLDVTPVADDAFEENDTAAAATPVNPGAYALTCRDDDWFRLTTAQPGSLRVAVDGPEGDLDLLLVDDEMNEIAVSAGSDSHENVSVEVPAGVCYVLVHPFNAQGGDYTLNVEFTSGPCGTFPPLLMFATVVGLLGLGSATRRRRPRAA